MKHIHLRAKSCDTDTTTALCLRVVFSWVWSCWSYSDSDLGMMVDLRHPWSHFNNFILNWRRPLCNGGTRHGLRGLSPPDGSLSPLHRKTFWSRITRQIVWNFQISIVFAVNVCKQCLQTASTSERVRPQNALPGLRPWTPDPGLSP